MEEEEMEELTVEEEDFIYVDEWDGTILTAGVSDPESDPPVPFIIDFTPTGLMHIGWSDRMKPPSEI